VWRPASSSAASPYCGTVLVVGDLHGANSDGAITNGNGGKAVLRMVQQLLQNAAATAAMKKMLVAKQM